MPAIEAALDLGVEMIEFDFRVTRDDEYVLIHDATARRTTAGSPGDLGDTDIAELTLEQLGSLDVGSWHRSFGQSTQIPSLRQALEAMRGRTVPLLERKAGDAAPLVRLLQEMSLIEDVMVSSFDLDWLTELHRLAPAITICALWDEVIDDDAIEQALATGASAFHGNARRVSPEAIDALRERGLLSYAYTVNEDLGLLGAGPVGLDGVTTNVPARLLELRRAGLVTRRP